MTTGLRSETADGLIAFDRLHYGKLAEGEAGRVPVAAGYEVTRRSSGLDAETERLLSPLRIAGLRRFEPEAIDLEARGTGCFIARVCGDNVVFMRARFRPEDGEGGHGRLHQQSAIWVGAFETWRGNPAGCLAVAARELRAEPDRIDECGDARLCDRPLRWRISAPDPAGVRGVVERAPWAFAMLQLFADGALTGDDALLDFGPGDFATEGDFLAAVGFALQFLPRGYPRWREISVASGLTHPLPGLCLRYRPSRREGRKAA